MTATDTAAIKSRTGLPERFPIWAGLAFWAAYLLSFSGTVESAGELDILAQAARLASFGVVPQSVLAWFFAPAMWLGQHLPGVNPVQVALLTNGLALALVTGLLAWAAQRRGLSARMVLWLALGFAALAIAQKFSGDHPPAPIWQTSAGDILPVHLYLLFPLAILGATVAGNIWLGWRAEKTIPLWLMGLLTVWLTVQFLLGAEHFSTQNIFVGDMEAARAVESAAPEDTLWLSVWGNDDPLATLEWWVGHARSAARLVAVHEDLPALPVAGRLWLVERGRHSADAPHPAAIALDAQAFPLDETWFDGARLSRYALAPADLPVVPVAVPFEGGISLSDFSVTAQTLSAGDALGVRLNWQTTGANESPVVAFVHLLAPSGDMAAQQDRLLPPSGGLQGYGLQLLTDAPPGDYPLVVGLYRQADGVRLIRADGNPDDFLYLTTISVKREE